MIKLRATRTLSGTYGTVRRGESFEATAANAKSLMRRGFAVAADETKSKAAAKFKPQGAN